jgi:hypothetical protein
MNRTFCRVVLAASALNAQKPTLQLNTVYQCPQDTSFNVFSCAGSADADACDVQSYAGGAPLQRGKSSRQQVMTMLSMCHPQTAAEARGSSQLGVSDAGIKVGDKVEVTTPAGWMTAQVLAINGNSYRVRTAIGGEVWKSYHQDLRRLGPATAQDNANGQYRVGDRVQALFEGRWIETKIRTEMNNEYQVDIPGDRLAWITAQNLRRSAAPPAPAPRKAGTPPKPGLVSCAGKIEGRYVAGGGFGNLTIRFHAGKATMTSIGPEDELECWTGGGRIFLHKPGEDGNDMPIDINDDGTLSTPMGKIRREGK